MPMDDEEAIRRFHCAHCDFVTSHLDTMELVKHVNEKHPEHTFLCGRRTHLSERMFGSLRDCWMKESNGDKTCVHCGSLSEDDFVDIMTHYVAGEAGYHFEHSDKTYKVYASRPGVRNGGEGGIKFYKVHVNKDGPDFQKHCELFNQAVQRSQKLFQEYLDSRGQQRH